MSAVNRSKAGGYAWKRHLRGVWPYLILLNLILAAYIAFAFAFLLAGRTGFSTTLVVSAAMFGSLYFIYRRIEAVDSRWGKGARGEQVVGKQLDKLYKEGFYVFHDYRAESRGNVDHFIVGPPGVFVVETKAWNGEITSDGERIFVNGRTFSKDPVKQVKGEAKDISKLIKETCGMSRWVHPVICFSSGELRHYKPVCSVEVAEVGALNRLIMTHRGWLSPDGLSDPEIKAISKMLERRIGVAPAAAPGFPPATRGRMRSFLPPDRVFACCSVLFLLLVSVTFADNTATTLEAFARFYRALGALLNYYF